MRKLLLTTALCLLCIASAWAQRYDFTAESGDNTLYYKITDADAKEVAVVSELYYYWDDDKGYTTAPTGTLTIPETVTHNEVEYKVTSIGDDAFRGCSGFTSIECLATTPPAADYSFFESIRSVPITVPLGCISTYRSAGGWSNLYNYQNHTTNYQVPGSYMLEYADGENGFKCKGLSEGETAGAADLIIPDSIEYNGTKYAVTSISCGAFENSYSEQDNDAGFTGSLTIGNNITRIEDYAFSGCGGFDDTLTIGSGITDLGYDLNNCNFSEIIVNNANTAYSSIDGILYNKAQDELIWYPAGKTGDVIVPNKVKQIASSAFWGCRYIGSITLGSGVEIIEGYTFTGCKFNELIVLSTTPPTMENDYDAPTFDFDALNIRGIKVYVPCSSVEDYYDAMGWDMFEHITEIRPYRFSAISDNEIKGQVEIIESSDCDAAEYTVTFEAVPTAGYKFIRWNDGVEDAERTISLSQDSTVIANFEVAYTIVYEANGGNGEMRSQNVAVGRRHTLSRNAYTKAGTSFEGWSTSADGAVEYTDGEQVAPLAAADEELKLYAVWGDGSSSLKDAKEELVYSVNDNVVTFSQTLDLRVYNAQGASIYAGTTDKVELPMAGMYIIQASTAGGWIQTIKVLSK